MAWRDSWAWWSGGSGRPRSPWRPPERRARPRQPCRQAQPSGGVSSSGIQHDCSANVVVLGSCLRNKIRAVPAIETEGLERTFGSRGRVLTAVDGIDIAVAPGEVYGFLGPNGAGKTTTVRMLVTLLKPTGGAARVAGFDVAKQPGDVRRRLRGALQEAALDLLMPGRELMELQATLHGLPVKDVHDRATQLITRVGLEQAQHRRVGTYSGGMRRRLDLAMALIHDPEVLFLDEPTTGLDPVSRVTLWEEVRRLKGEGTTVFLTTQYLEEADQLADRVGIISSGRIVAEGTPAALKAEVGRPHLDLTFTEGDREAAERVLAEFGRVLPARDGVLQVTL